MLPKEERKKIIAWSFYDWANSAFALTVMGAFFPGFFKGFWSTDVDTAISTARLGIGSAFAGLIVAILSPVLGAIAGVGHSKKKFLFFWVVVGCAGTALLFFIPMGAWIAAISAYILARMGFSLANLFYDALLIDVSNKKNRDMVSSFGYAVGYLGCGILFVLNLVMYKNPSWFGLESGGQAVRVSFLIVAAWWLIFTIPLMVTVTEKNPVRREDSIFKIISDGMKRFKNTVGDILKIKGVMLFLLAYWFYIDGMHTIVMMATDYGLSIGLSMGSLMIALLVVQIVAFPSAIGAGFIAKKIGAQKTILTAISVYTLIALGCAWIMNDDKDFIFFAAITGMVQGAIQALSRSLFTTMIPEDRETSFFGFYNMVGRFAVILGPAIVGGCNLALHTLGVNSQLAARSGFSMLAILFIVGGVLLLKVNPHSPQSDKTA